MEDETTHRSATEGELTQILSVPAPGVNKTFITLGQTGLRITFAEEMNGIIAIRNAVTMHPQDGLKLIDILQIQLADIKIQLDKLTTQSEKANG